MIINKKIIKSILEECNTTHEQDNELEKLITALDNNMLITAKYGRRMSDVLIYSYKTDTSWSPEFVECSNIAHLYYYIADLIVFHNAVITSIKHIAKDGSTPRVAFKSDPEFTKILKEVKTESKRKHDAAVEYLRREASNAKYYEIIEDSYKYENGLMLIVYFDEEYEHEVWHLCVNVEDF